MVAPSTIALLQSTNSFLRRGKDIVHLRAELAEAASSCLYEPRHSSREKADARCALLLPSFDSAHGLLRCQEAIREKKEMS